MAAPRVLGLDGRPLNAYRYAVICELQAHDVAALLREVQAMGAYARAVLWDELQAHTQLPVVRYPGVLIAGRPGSQAARSVPAGA